MEVGSVAELKRSLADAHPPAGLSAPLSALWYAGRTLSAPLSELVEVYAKVPVARLLLFHFATL